MLSHAAQDICKTLIPISPSLLGAVLQVAFCLPDKVSPNSTTRLENVVPFLHNTPLLSFIREKDSWEDLVARLVLKRGSDRLNYAACLESQQIMVVYQAAPVLQVQPAQRELLGKLLLEELGYLRGMPLSDGDGQVIPLLVVDLAPEKLGDGSVLWDSVGDGVNGINTDDDAAAAAGRKAYNGIRIRNLK
jgi:hypothetical protein